jgi:hypothetical protein
LLSGGNGRGYCDRHRLSDLVLHLENIDEIAIVTLCPDVLARLGLNQLRGGADAVAGRTQAAFEDIADAQLVPDLPDSTARPL